jgi:hypothetical protein
MKTGLALIGVVAILAGSGPTRAGENELPAGSTLKSVTESVGENATVTDAYIIGQKNGEDFSISVGGGNLQMLSTPWGGTPCARPGYCEINAGGGYFFVWCANRRSYNGVNWEVQKDWYESAGSTSPKKKWLLDCQNPTDFASLPDHDDTGHSCKALCP